VSDRDRVPVWILGVVDRLLGVDDQRTEPVLIDNFEVLQGTKVRQERFADPLLDGGVIAYHHDSNRLLRFLFSA
jgi:hypothetical protein